MFDPQLTSYEDSPDSVCIIVLEWHFSPLSLDFFYCDVVKSSVDRPDLHNQTSPSVCEAFRSSNFSLYSLITEAPTP